MRHLNFLDLIAYDMEIFFYMLSCLQTLWHCTHMKSLAHFCPRGSRDGRLFSCWICPHSGLETGPCGLSYLILSVYWELIYLRDKLNSWNLNIKPDCSFINLQCKTSVRGWNAQSLLSSSSRTNGKSQYDHTVCGKHGTRIKGVT